MDRCEIVALLSQSKPELQQRFGVVRLALFGHEAGRPDEVVVT